MKKLIATIITLVASYFAAFPVGHWFAHHYVVSGEFYFGYFPGYDAGFFLSYSFFAALIIGIISNNLKYGLYFSLPVIVLDILLGAYNPLLWMNLILLAVGLGLAHVILKLKAK